MTEFERILKKAVVAYLEVLSRHLPGGNEENNRKPQSGQTVTELRFESRPPENKVGVVRSVSSLQGTYRSCPIPRRVLHQLVLTTAKIKFVESYGDTIFSRLKALRFELRPYPLAVQVQFCCVGLIILISLEWLGREIYFLDKHTFM